MLNIRHIRLLHSPLFTFVLYCCDIFPPLFYSQLICAVWFPRCWEFLTAFSLKDYSTRYFICAIWFFRCQKFLTVFSLKDFAHERQQANVTAKRLYMQKEIQRFMIIFILTRSYFAIQK